MMKIKEIAFVCCAVSDMSGARAFYEGNTGLETKCTGWSGHLLIEYDVGAGTFAIESNPDWPVSPDGMSVTFEVEDFEVALKHLRDHGITFFLEPTETKVCHWAAFRDPDGNRLSSAGESESHSEVGRLRSGHRLVEAAHLIFELNKHFSSFINPP